MNRTVTGRRWSLLILVPAMVAASTNANTQVVNALPSMATTTIVAENPRNPDPSYDDGTLSTPRKYQLPPPFTAQEFWAKVVQLLKDAEGHVTPEQFEKKFDVKMFKREYEQGTQYGVVAGAGWYFNAILIFEDAAKFKGQPGFSGIRSSLVIEWPQDAFDGASKGSYTQSCVRGSDAIKALVNSGWTLTRKRSWAYIRAAVHDSFSLGESSLDLFHYDYIGTVRDDNDTCVYRFYVRSKP